ncbi:MAG: VanW family protein [Tannerellaceae bacterium]|jgi:glycosyltransferase involved in cell wall biosynthesis|nr:VanW family protein [Tannerellaceae bacterium]
MAKSTQKKVSGADLPTPAHGFFFAIKAWGLRTLRAVKDALAGITRYGREDTWDNAALLGKSSSELWHDKDTAMGLTAGKVHNLRLASAQLDGTVVPAGQVFSFWKQVGRLTKRRRFARGRELREGCIIPTTGGGICQLSNAIYDAAARAGLEIVERHRHTAVIPGSLAETDRDATVFWNYVDLRLRAPFAWQLCVKMNASSLAVSILSSSGAMAPGGSPKQRREPDALGDCTQCGRTDCYLHVGDIPLPERKTWLVTGEEFPEFKAWRAQNIAENDRAVSCTGRTLGARWMNFWSRAWRQYHLYRRHPLPLAQNSRFMRAARFLAKKLKESDTYLIIPQELLPWLQMLGELRGRRYEVLMNALPVSEIERRLDEATAMYPDVFPLTNYRAAVAFTRAEHDALAGACQLISPHAEILRTAGSRGLQLPWILPTPPAINAKGSTDSGDELRIMLAAPSLARKGVYALREALREMPFRTLLMLPPGKPEAPDMWKDLKVDYAVSMADGVARADIVVLPAWIEHQPRGLLLAVALGKPVIATPECGLPTELSWISVAAGDAAGLRQAIIAARNGL